jgi:hypothetical protein
MFLLIIVTIMTTNYNCTSNLFDLTGKKYPYIPKPYLFIYFIEANRHLIYESSKVYKLRSMITVQLIKQL